MLQQHPLSRIHTMMVLKLLFALLWILAPMMLRISRPLMNALGATVVPHAHPVRDQTDAHVVDAEDALCPFCDAAEAALSQEIRCDLDKAFVELTIVVVLKWELLPVKVAIPFPVGFAMGRQAPAQSMEVRQHRPNQTEKQQLQLTPL